MRRTTVLFALLAVAAGLLFIGCSQEEQLVLEPLEKGEIDAETLWLRITEENPYTNYEYLPGHEGLRPGQAPHGPFHKVFVNHTLIEALPVESKIAPHGTLIVKENYSTDEELSAITVMAKVKQFAPNDGNWFWTNYAPDGTVRVSGRVSSCIECHAGMKSNDYVIIRPLDAPIKEN
ncbi:MAG: cytochrome P460 family protein [Spirochaetia bacterium]|nr:cytochrome P460 family protein [Spirochaetia bacterium]